MGSSSNLNHCMYYMETVWGAQRLVMLCNHQTVDIIVVVLPFAIKTDSSINAFQFRELFLLRELRHLLTNQRQQTACWNWKVNLCSNDNLIGTQCSRKMPTFCMAIGIQFNKNKKNISMALHGSLYWISIGKTLWYFPLASLNLLTLHTPRMSCHFRTELFN